MSDTLIFEHIKQDFTGDCAVGREKMRIIIGKFSAPANKGGNPAGYMAQADTEFFYDGKSYISLIVENITITGIMKVNGATPLVAKNKAPELYNFAYIKDEKVKEAYEAALLSPQNADLMTINDKNGARVIKPGILVKKYAPNCMSIAQDVELENPSFLIKFRINPAIRYIYSCAIDIVKSDGTIEILTPKRPMPFNTLSEIKKSMKSQLEMYFAGKDLDKMFSSGEFVHDLPKQDDIIDFIPAYSKISVGKFELNAKCNIIKQTPYYTCDFLPSYLQIKPNPKYDIAATVNQMRNYKNTVSKEELNYFENDPSEDENNNNL